MTDERLTKLIGRDLPAGVAIQDGSLSDAPAVIFADADYEVGDGACGIHERAKYASEPCIPYLRADAILDALSELGRLRQQLAEAEHQRDRASEDYERTMHRVGQLESQLAATEGCVERGEPVAWQFYQDGKWHNGNDSIADHRKNTESAGMPTRDLYAGAPPAQSAVPPEREMLQRIVDELSIMDDSEGVAGFHLNGDVSPWDEGELPRLRDEAHHLLSDAPSAGEAQHYPDDLGITRTPRELSERCAELARRLVRQGDGREAWWDAIDTTLRSYHCSETLTDDGDGLDLCDALCAPGATDASTGLREIELLRDELIMAVENAMGDDHAH